MNQRRILKVSVPLLGILTALALYHHRLATNGDNLDYIMIASSVLRGDIFNPFHWRFPVGYPYFVSAILSITGFKPNETFLAISSGHLNALKIAGVLLIVPALLATIKWCVTVKSRHLILLPAFIATSQVFSCVFSVIGSEPLFIVFSLLALYLWERLAEFTFKIEPNATSLFNKSSSLIVFVSFSSFMAMQLRQIGMSLAVAAILYTFVTGNWRNRYWRKCVYYGAILPLVISIFLMIASNPSHLSFIFRQSGIGDYSHQATFTVSDRLIINASAYKVAVIDIIFQKVLGSNGILHMLNLGIFSFPIVIVAYLLVISGTVVVIKNRHRPGMFSMLYLFTTLAIILVWPFQSGRFFVPLVPLVAWLAFLGLDTAFQIFRLNLRYATLFLSLLVFWQIATNSYAAIKNITSMWNWKDKPVWFNERYLPTTEFDFADLLECGEWLLNNSETNCVVISSKAPFVQVSGMRSTYYPMSMMDKYEFSKRENVPLYVVVDSFPDTCSYGRMKHEYILPFIEKYKSSIQLVHTAPYSGAKIYKYHNNHLHSYGFPASGKAEGEP